MADSIALRYRGRHVVFEKSTTLVAARARAGMEIAMEADVDTIAVPGGSATRKMIGPFQVIRLRASAAGLEQDLDWLRARASVAAASHVFSIKGQTALMVPSGHIELLFNGSLSGHEQRALINRYRLQTVETRGYGSYLVTVTSGSKNPISTAMALQSEPGVSLAELEFVDMP